MSQLDNAEALQRPESKLQSNHQRLYDQEGIRQLSQNTVSPREQMAGSVSFGNEIYANAHDPLGLDVKRLSEDLHILKATDKNDPLHKDFEQELARDEANLKQDVFAFKDASTSFESFSDTMMKYHKELKDIADGLWGMGMKDQASQTTAYYPLEHYKHEFDNRNHGGKPEGPPEPPTQPGDPPPKPGDPSPKPGDPPPKPGDPPPTGGPGVPPDAVTYTNLESASGWRKDAIASDIGGSGKVTGFDIKNNPDGSLEYDTSGGAWADTLVGKSFPEIGNKQNLKLSWDVNVAGNVNCLETDLVQTYNGEHRVYGSQLVNKGDHCELQFWNQQDFLNGGGGWVTAAETPPLTPGQHSFSLQTENISGGNKYVSFVMDGKEIPLTNTIQPVVKNNWSNGTIVQLQEDLAGNGGTIKAQYSNMTLQAW